jgi:hypothetical protein
VTIAILATGPSMSQALADSLSHLRRIAVNDAFRLAPDAEALCANDRAWWTKNKDALRFKGRKFSVSAPHGSEIERVARTTVIESGTNSALLALHVAVTKLGEKCVLLYGVDMSAANGHHYFGAHDGLANTVPVRFEVFKQQFARYKATLPKDVEVLNATPGSALLCFPFLS